MNDYLKDNLINKKFYLIGIGGAGMSGIAELLFQMGFMVKGSDKLESAVTLRLRNFGIKVFIGHSKYNINKNDIIIYSEAIKKNNEILQYARKNNLIILSRMEILSELMRLRYGISITGSHGKTTTTSILSFLLAKSNLDPTYLIGGKLKTGEN